jgi:uncharacterized membrane protein YgdD (TMEM256/DUF423 family)
MKTNHILALGFFMLTVCVIISAFGAHSLKNLLLRNNTKETFDLAARYLMYHSLGVVVLGIVQQMMSGFSANWPVKLMVIGTAIFSGTLFLLSLTNITWLGAITPLGGLCLIAAWALAGFKVWKLQ